jgi:hypothetical protein
MTKKTATVQRRSPSVATLFEVDRFFEFTDSIQETPPEQREARTDKNHEPLTTPKMTGRKKSAIAPDDRRRLHDLDVFLNNCLNLARGIETKYAAKIVQSLCDAKAQIRSILAK